jgi:hypothetical protein
MSNRIRNYSAFFPKPLQMSSAINAWQYSMTATIQIWVYPQFAVTFPIEILRITYGKCPFHNNWDNTIFRDISQYLPDYTASHPRRQPPSVYKISQNIKTNEATVKFWTVWTVWIVTSLRPVTWGRMAEWKQSSVGFRSRYEVRITPLYPLDESRTGLTVTARSQHSAPTGYPTRRSLKWNYEVYNIIVSVAVLHDAEPSSGEEWEAPQKQVLLISEVNVSLVLHDGVRFRCMNSSLHSSFICETTFQYSSEPW